MQAQCYTVLRKSNQITYTCNLHRQAVWLAKNALCEDLYGQVSNYQKTGLN